MDKIIVEDRTEETLEQKLEREIFAAGKLLVGFTIQLSGARPVVGLGALAYALGMGAARVGASLEDVLNAVRVHYEATQAAMQDEAEAQEIAAGTRPGS
jgi:hypothetical protein